MSAIVKSDSHTHSLASKIFDRSKAKSKGINLTFSLILNPNVWILSKTKSMFASEGGITLRTNGKNATVEHFSWDVVLGAVFSNEHTGTNKSVTIGSYLTVSQLTSFFYGGSLEPKILYSVFKQYAYYTGWLNKFSDPKMVWDFLISTMVAHNAINPEILALERFHWDQSFNDFANGLNPNLAITKSEIAAMGKIEPDTDKSDTDTDKSDTEPNPSDTVDTEPKQDKPDTDKPDTDKSDTDKSDTDKSDTDKTDTDTPKKPRTTKK